MRAKSLKSNMLPMGIPMGSCFIAICYNISPSGLSFKFL